MRRANLLCGGFLVALGAISLFEIVQKWAALVEEAAKDPAFLEQALKVNKVIAYKGPETF